MKCEFYPNNNNGNYSNSLILYSRKMVYSKILSSYLNINKCFKIHKYKHCLWLVGGREEEEEAEPHVKYIWACIKVINLSGFGTCVK